MSEIRDRADSTANRFRENRILTRDPAVLSRFRSLETEFSSASQHRQGLQFLGSDFTFTRRVTSSDCTRLQLPPFFAGTTLCLIRLHPELEKSFGIYAEIPAVYSPFDDVRGAFVQCLPRILEILPPEKGGVERSVFFIFSGLAPHDQIRRHNTPELRLIHLPSSIPPRVGWGDAVFSAISETLFSTNLYSRQGYVVGEQFYGREKVLLQLQSNITNHRVSGIFGLRKTGKTSVVMQLIAEATLDACFVYRDLENLESVRFGDPIAKLIVGLADDIRQGLGQHGGWVQSLALFVETVRAGKTEATLDGFDEALRLTLHNKKNRNIRLILVLDEIENLLPSDMKSIPVQRPQDDIARFFSCLRARWQSHDNFVFVLAGVTATAFEYSELYGRSNPLFRIAEPIWLSYLSASESAELLSSIGRRQGMDWGAAACERAFLESGGHPLLVRQIGSAVFNALPSDRSETISIDESMVSSSLDNYRKASSNDVSEMLDHMQKFYPEDFDILLALVDGMSVDEAVVLSPSGIDRLERLGLILVDEEWAPTPLLTLVPRFLPRSLAPPNETVSLHTLLGSGETDQVEYKASFSVDILDKGIPQEKIQWGCLRAIVSFLNSRGGTLLIGVGDDGSVLGLDPDIRLRGSRDKFIRTVNTALRDNVGPAEYSACRIDFMRHLESGHEVLRVWVPPSRGPVFLTRAHKGGGDPARLYVRNHAQTDELSGRDLLNYTAQHWRTS